MRNLSERNSTIDLKAVRTQLQQVIKEAKARTHKKSSSGTAAASKGQDPEIFAGLQVTDKEMYEVLQGSKSYSESLSVKQAREKLAYIEKKYKGVVAREQAVKQGEDQCISLRNPGV